MSYQKLVRDKIPAIIKANGGTPKTRVLNDQEYLTELIKKLHEETDEFTADPSLEELADIQEVVLALLASIDENLEALENKRLQKAQERGAFQDKIYLEGVA